jgi:hypothetical protein
MTRLTWILLLLLFQGCRTDRGKAVRNAEAVHSGTESSRIEFAEQIHHFGTIHAGEIVAYTFVFRNPGPGIMELGETESGCSCLTVMPGKKPVPQGEEGRIEVIFNTAGLSGKQYHTFRIRNSAGTIRKDLAISAEIINDKIHF